MRHFAVRQWPCHKKDKRRHLFSELRNSSSYGFLIKPNPIELSPVPIAPTSFYTYFKTLEEVRETWMTLLYQNLFSRGDSSIA